MAEDPLETLFVRWKAGDREAREALFTACFKLLYPRARRLMRGERPDHTLSPTALLNETWAALGSEDQLRATCVCPGHLLARFARRMERILIDHARAVEAGKRPPRKLRVELVAELAASAPDLAVRVDLDQACDRLERTEPDLHAVLALGRLRMTETEIAAQLGIAVATVKKRRRRAREWFERHAPGLAP